MAGGKSRAAGPGKRQAHGMTNGIPTGGMGRHATALDRVLPAIGGMDTVQRLAALSGSDFTSVMLEGAPLPAARENPVSVRRRYAHDRFTEPGHTPWRAIRRAEEDLLACLPAEVEMLTLAPVAPLGTHSARDPVSQNKVLTTIRSCEVAADPTNALALEAALRRAHDAETTVWLGGLQ